jgi:hypothetical protein
LIDKYRDLQTQREVERQQRIREAELDKRALKEARVALKVSAISFASVNHYLPCLC